MNARVVLAQSELEANNERPWFNANKARYEEQVLAPALAFVEAVGGRLPVVSPHFLAVARRTGGSVMRVYRDTRFGGDKRPYKTNLGIQFRHEVGKDVHAPGFYFHIDPSTVFLGAGMWRPDRGSLGAIRDRIVERGEEWERVRDAIVEAGYRLGGEALKRAPRGFDAEHPLHRRPAPDRLHRGHRSRPRGHPAQDRGRRRGRALRRRRAPGGVPVPRHQREVLRRTRGERDGVADHPWLAIGQG